MAMVLRLTGLTIGPGALVKPPSWDKVLDAGKRFKVLAAFDGRGGNEPGGR